MPAIRARKAAPAWGWRSASRWSSRWAAASASTAAGARERPSGSSCRLADDGGGEVVLAGGGDANAQELTHLRALGALHLHQPVDLRRIGAAAPDRRGSLHLVHDHLLRGADLARELRAADVGLHFHEARTALLAHLL